MPFYEYRCEAAGCGHTWDESVPVGNRNGPRQCPACERLSGRRLFTPTQHSWGWMQSP